MFVNSLKFKNSNIIPQYFPQKQPLPIVPNFANFNKEEKAKLKDNLENTAVNSFLLGASSLALAKLVQIKESPYLIAGIGAVVLGLLFLVVKSYTETNKSLDKLT